MIHTPTSMGDRMLKTAAMKSRTSTASPPARPFQCQWHEGCPKSFNRKSDLQRHYRIHTNERPYACDYKPCEKTFIQRSALTVHRRTHTGDKPHKCPYVGCGKCFSDSSSLARHRRIHTNDKPYICKNLQCRKAFCRKTTMTKHFRKEHPTESLDQEEDADFTDGDFSDDEPGLEHDVDSLSSSEYPFDGRIKSERGSNAVASNYNTNLWALPGQSTQRTSKNPVVKMERSLSGTSQRSLPEGLPHQVGFISRSSTLPTSAPRSSAPDMSIWDQPMHSPMSMSPAGEYATLHSMPTSSPAFEQNLPIRRPNLQPVHDLIHDDPSQYINHHPRQAHQHGSQFPANYRTEMPQTPVNGRHMAQFTHSIEDDGIHLESYTVPGNNIYNLPTVSQPVGMLADFMDPWKDPNKIDGPWSQMPDPGATQWPH